MFEVGLILIGLGLVGCALLLVIGLIVAVTKDEDWGAVIGIGGYIVCWALMVIGGGIAIIGAVQKFL